MHRYELMETASVKKIKEELRDRPSQELLQIVLRLSKFKKENKELLTYLLFQTDDELGYVQEVKMEVDEQFALINTSSYYFMKKSIRKILRNIKKHSRYSGKKETEVELLIYFCRKMRGLEPSMYKNNTLVNLYDRQINLIKKNLPKFHEDLQHDYLLELKELEEH